MSKKIQIGLIGAGMIGDVYIERIRQDGRGEVTWIAAKTEKTLREKLRKYGIENGSTDYRDMLNDPDTGAVIIAAPPFLHLQMLADVLAAGKHVLLEKPMVVNREELNALQALVLQYPDLKILECSCRHARLQPKFTWIRNMIDSGAIGEVYHIHHRSLSRGTFIEYNPAGVWAHQKKLAGAGPFLDQGVYDLSFHLGLLHDKPRLSMVRSFQRHGLKSYSIPGFQSDIEEHGAAWMEFDTGLTYYYERGSGVQAEVPNETRLFGTHGSLRLAFNSWESLEADHFFIEKGEEKHELLKVAIPDGHDDNLALIRHFLDVLTGQAESQMTVGMAAKHLDILMKILGQ